MLSLVQDVLGCPFPDAVQFALAVAGYGGEAPSPVHRLTKPEPEPDHKNREKAVRFWQQGHPIRGTVAERYLQQRGLWLEDWPRSLRFHPGLWHADSGKAWPALLAAVQGQDGRLQAVYRTWLDPVTGKKPPSRLSARYLEPSKVGRCGWHCQRPPLRRDGLLYVKGWKTA